MAPILQSEAVTVWEHQILATEEVQIARPGEMVTPRTDGTFVWLPPYDRVAPDHFLNHSCDPNVWLADEVTLVARRRIESEEELTVDYATFELKLDFVSPFTCRCGTVYCRQGLSGVDWQRPDLQARYAGHWHPVLEGRIAAAKRGLHAE